jgi:hypothetical protein
MAWNGPGSPEPEPEQYNEISAIIKAKDAWNEVAEYAGVVSYKPSAHESNTIQRLHAAADRHFYEILKNPNITRVMIGVVDIKGLKDYLKEISDTVHAYIENPGSSGALMDKVGKNARDMNGLLQRILHEYRQNPPKESGGRRRRTRRNRRKGHKGKSRRSRK